MSRYKHEEITGQIIDAAHTVHNKLGYGFLEKVYHNSLVIELRKRNLFAEPEKPIEVNYDGQTVGEYFADIVVDNKVIVEVKATDKHNPVFEAQLLNYLKATGLGGRPDYQLWHICQGQTNGFIIVYRQQINTDAHRLKNTQKVKNKKNIYQ